MEEKLEWINELVSRFDTVREKIRLPDTSRIFFVDDALEGKARSIGQQIWLPVPRTYRIFICAYSALFAIPSFTDEALARHQDRFSLKRLPLTIRNTSSFILDAFGYDRRMERERKVLYSPTPAISSNHRETDAKARISDAAMAYFGVHLIKFAEHDADLSSEESDWHFDYLATFFRNAGYAFPVKREAQAYISAVDSQLASEKHSELWNNAVHAAASLSTDLKPSQIADLLPPKSGRLFATATRQKGEQDES